MVDFGKELDGKKVEKVINPIELYNTLDRTHDKGPLRPAQSIILSDWYENHQQTRDVIVKLHTGQGKTLIGLLMLQSRLNAGLGPVIYLCPNHFLIGQTCEQAKQFGIRTCIAESDLPHEFLNSESILVTTVKKLFHGHTKFGLKNQSIDVDTVLMDDAHACADLVREACRIRIPRSEEVYSILLTLFSQDLEEQGAGTYADILNKNPDALLPVPYWAWVERESEIAGILSRHSKSIFINYVWPLLKDILRYCQCVVSSEAIEIEPYIAPLIDFGSYSKAKHRIFMSATVTDDAFLVKGLQLKPETITKPLTYSKETWSGEKMVLLPSLIHDGFDREAIISMFAGPQSQRSFGIVALTPSFPLSKIWEKQKAIVLKTDTVWDAISNLKKGEFENTVVLANRYDGIDLPDDACRILIFDSRPYSESLIDLYQERCRPNSEATLMRTIRSIEQGMGRSVRGEKDYSIIIIIGTDLVRLLREKKSSKYLSAQIAKQIEIGINIAPMAKKDIEDGTTPSEALKDLMKKCLKRDPAWKAYHSQQMEKVVPTSANESLLKVYAAELEAENLFLNKDYAGACDIIQRLLDSGVIDNDDKGWYLQESARYLYKNDRVRSQNLQVTAHNKNRLLLKPPIGVTVTQLTIISHGRAERIAKWVNGFSSYSELDATISDILSNLVFGIKAAKFEQALDELSKALGFVGERPDAEWKEGPDNLWALESNQYLLIECKNEVLLTRSEINKDETDQMNRSSVWFEKHYPGMSVKRIIIHPAGKIESAAAFSHEVEGVRDKELKRLIKSCRDFFKSFESHNFKDLSSQHIQSMLTLYKLSVEDLISKYSRKLKDIK